MASVFKRTVYAYDAQPDGTKVRRETGTSWNAKYKDAAGAWKLKAVPVPAALLAKGTERKIENWAQRWADDHEAKVQAEGATAPKAPELCGNLMDEWEKTLTNRNAKIDKGRLAKHVRPEFKDQPVRAVEVKHVMRWIDKQRAVKRVVDGQEVQALSDASVRQNMNLLSRFFSWAITRGHCDVNPVRNIPTGQRPQQTPKRDQPYIANDADALRMIAALAEPYSLMFYIGHTSGLRLGEVLGLRMSDVDTRFLEAGALRVRWSYSGPLKEDKKGKAGRPSKPKYPPIGAEFEEMLRPHIARRLAAGAEGEAFLFVREDGEPFDAVKGRQAVYRAWVAAKEAEGVAATFYQGTRHSFASRHLANGNAFEEVSPALGHASVTTTQRHYDHHKVVYSPSMRMRLGVTPPPAAPILPIRGKATAAK